jgi:hypothetical protein
MPEDYWRRSARRRDPSHITKLLRTRETAAKEPEVNVLAKKVTFEE